MSFPHTGSTVLTNGVSECSRLAVSKDTHEAISGVSREKLIVMHASSLRRRRNLTAG